MNAMLTLITNKLCIKIAGKGVINSPGIQEPLQLSSILCKESSKVFVVAHSLLKNEGFISIGMTSGKQYCLFLNNL
jgi:hypothetical protein